MEPSGSDAASPEKSDAGDKPQEKIITLNAASEFSEASDRLLLGEKKTCVWSSIGLIQQDNFVFYAKMWGI